MLEALAHVTIFRAIHADGLTYLAEHGEWRTFPTGTELIRQGERSDSLHVVLSGRVRIERSHPLFTAPLDLAELGPYEIVGADGVLEGQVRWATAIAVEDTETIELSRAAIVEAMHRHVETAAVLQRLLKRAHRPGDQAADSPVNS